MLGLSWPEISMPLGRKEGRASISRKGLAAARAGQTWEKLQETHEKVGKIWGKWDEWKNGMKHDLVAKIESHASGWRLA